MPPVMPTLLPVKRRIRLYHHLTNINVFTLHCSEGGEDHLQKLISQPYTKRLTPVVGHVHSCLMDYVHMQVMANLHLTVPH